MTHFGKTDVRHYKQYMSCLDSADRLFKENIWKSQLEVLNVRVPIIAKKYTSFRYYSLHVSCHVKISRQISALFIYLVRGIIFISFSSISTHFWLKINPVHELRFTGRSSTHYCLSYLFVIFHYFIGKKVKTLKESNNIR